MHIYKIYVNGKAYMGESDETYPANYGGGGWQVSNHGTRAKLLFRENETAMEIGGERNFKSHITRIVDRIKDGTVEANRITIDVFEEIKLVRKSYRLNCQEILDS